jgi:hypothetical protein
VTKPSPERTAATGYTRVVTWRARVALLALAVVGLLPVSGTVCALLCSTGLPASHAHHEAGHTMDHSPSPSSLRWAVADGHDCAAHDRVVRPAAAPVASRADAAMLVPPADLSILVSLLASREPLAIPEYVRSAGATPPGTAPPVLRI